MALLVLYRVGGDHDPQGQSGRLLGGMQQLALLFAAHKENRPISVRFKAPADLKRKWQ